MSPARFNKNRLLKVYRHHTFQKSIGRGHGKFSTSYLLVILFIYEMYVRVTGLTTTFIEI